MSAFDSHMFTWALGNGQPFDEVDDEDANYHGLCGYRHGPSTLDCPMTHHSEDG